MLGLFLGLLGARRRRSGTAPMRTPAQRKTPLRTLDITDLPKFLLLRPVRSSEPVAAMLVERPSVAPVAVDRIDARIGRARIICCRAFLGGNAMRLPRRTIPASGRRCRRASRRLPHRQRASLPVATDPDHHRLYAGGLGRHHRAPDGAMAVGAARPDGRDRKPARRRHQSRDRGGRARARRRLHAAAGRARERDQRHAVRQAQPQLPARHRAGGGHQPLRQCHGGEPGGAGENRSRVHRLCQGQSGQAQHGVVGRRLDDPHVGRAVQDDDRHPT